MGFETGNEGFLQSDYLPGTKWRHPEFISGSW